MLSDKSNFENLINSFTWGKADSPNEPDNLACAFINDDTIKPTGATTLEWDNQNA